MTQPEERALFNQPPIYHRDMGRTPEFVPARYTTLTVLLHECDGGYVLECGDRRTIIKTFDEVPPLLAAYRAEIALART